MNNFLCNYLIPMFIIIDGIVGTISLFIYFYCEEIANKHPGPFETVKNFWNNGNILGKIYTIIIVLIFIIPFIISTIIIIITNLIISLWKMGFKKKG